MLIDEWTELAPLWLDEVAHDPIFESDVLPLLEAVVGAGPGSSDGRWLDVGCGEGRVMRTRLGATVGCDISMPLLARAATTGPVARCRLPDLGWLQDGVFDGAYAVLVFEHLADIDRTFAELYRVIRASGALAVVANHPAFTANGAGPIVDLTDGEVLWRWGPYFEEAPSDVRIGAERATMYHRSFGRILTAAATAGWRLDMAVERPMSAAAVTAEPGYFRQEAIPRLVGFRWRR